MTFILGLWIGTSAGALVAMLALGLGRAAADADSETASAYAEAPGAANR